MELGGLRGILMPSVRVLGGGTSLRTFLGSKEQQSPTESIAGVMFLSMRIHPKSCCLFPLKITATLYRGSRKGTFGA